MKLSGARTDWCRLLAMTGKEVRAAIVEDPDARPTNEAFWETALVVVPRRRRRGYQLRVNPMLRAYMNARSEEQLSLLTGSIEEIAEQAEKILTSVAPTACCQAQEWDSRIDCLIKLPDGSVAGEMVRLSEATEQRFLEAGERLEKRRLGIPVILQDELLPPIRIVRRDPP